MASLTDLLTVVLATYALAVTIAKLHGPFGLAERLRWAVYDWRAVDPADPEALAEDWIATGVGCPLCLSFWIAVSIGLPVGLGLISSLAAAGGSMALYMAGRWG